MQPLQEAYPETARILRDEGRFVAPRDYRPLIDSMGHDVLLLHKDDDYSGDSRLLLRKADGRYGFMIFSWSLCGGYDAIKACKSFDDMEELRDRLAAGIVWHTTPQDMICFLMARDWPAQATCWTGNPATDDFCDFIGDCIALLGREFAKELSRKELY